MAVDIVLVLRSEHRRIQQLIDRCGRTSRGFHEPLADLQQALRAHVLAATAEIYPSVAKVTDPHIWPADRLTEVRTVVEADHAPERELIMAAEDLMALEEQSILPFLGDLELLSRRRLGKVFRIRRDAAVRAASSTGRRRRSQTELYELARRAGVEHRSRMTQSELQAAIEDRGLQA